MGWVEVEEEVEESLSELGLALGSSGAWDLWGLWAWAGRTLLGRLLREAWEEV